MDIAVLLGIFAAIAAFAAAIKGLPVIWGAAKTFYRFLIGLSEAPEIPSLLQGHIEILAATKENQEAIKEATQNISRLSNELREHMLEEERLRLEEKGMVQQLAESMQGIKDEIKFHTYRTANVVFRQVVHADPIAYYTIQKAEDGRWDFTWGNKAYYDLTGLTEEQARTDRYWDAIKEDERDKIYKISTSARDTSSPLDVVYTNINVKTHEQTTVNLLAYPMVDNDGEANAYLGLINKLVD